MSALTIDHHGSSYWRPSPQELNILNAGGQIRVNAPTTDIQVQVDIIERDSKSRCIHCNGEVLPLFGISSCTCSAR